MYQKRIEKELQKHGWCDDPRHIEAYMRLSYGTLDNISTELFNEEVVLCHHCIKEDGVCNAEELAQSYGL